MEFDADIRVRRAVSLQAAGRGGLSLQTVYETKLMIEKNKGDVPSRRSIARPNRRKTSSPLTAPEWPMDTPIDLQRLYRRGGRSSTAKSRS
jgi:hypothetical protein